MLKKLLKYELKSIYKFLSVFYILSVSFAILTRILFKLEELNSSTFLIIITNISLGCLIAMLANALINTIMRNWVRAYENLYKDESYLTHTLPVTKKELYTSKFIIALTTLFTTFIVIIISLLITFYSKNFFLQIKELLLSSMGLININFSLLIIGLILVLFLEIFSALHSGLLGIILGNRKSNHKIIYSIIYGGIVSLAGQTILIIVFLLAGLFSPEMMKIFTSNYLSEGTIKLLLVLSIIIYILINIFIKLIAEKQLSKGVNVD